MDTIQQEEQSLTNTQKESQSHLPNSFIKFLHDNQIDHGENFSQEVIESMPRYIRINPNKKINPSDISTEVGHELTPIDWIDNVYSVPADSKISHLECYKSGEIYGIDLSSCAVVKALDPEPREAILDLCCAPGSKLCYIADIVKQKYNEKKQEQNSGSNSEKGDKEEQKEKENNNSNKNKDVKKIADIHGVDINQHRLNICGSLSKKYGHQDVLSLFCEDGTTFKGPSYQQNIDNNSEESKNNIQKFEDDSTRKPFLYDRILIDAECTHDGSVKHLLKFNKSNKKIEFKKQEKELNLNMEVNEGNTNNEQTQSIKKEEEPKISNKERKRREKQRFENLERQQKKKFKGNNEWNEESFDDRVMNPAKVDNITSLQKNLLNNGFSLLKDGGILVYSTCSLTRGQNEGVIEWALNENELTKGKLKIIDAFDEKDLSSIPIAKVEIPKTIRFDPKTSKSGGMFIAKMRKIG